MQLVSGLLGAGATVGLLLPWGRGQESEADHLGLIYMAKAGYHPQAARDLWVRMGEASKGRTSLEFLSTHPLAGHPDRPDRGLDPGGPAALQAPLNPVHPGRSSTIPGGTGGITPTGRPHHGVHEFALKNR